MTTLAYHRPETIAAALALLEADGAEILAGGTVLNARREPPQIVIDVQALGLDRRSKDNDAVTFGAMVRLQDLVDDPDTPPLISEAAYREGPNTLRNAATLGGVVAGANWESELLASLLVHEAVVMVEHRDRREELSLSQLLAEKDRLSRGIITSLRVGSGGIGSATRTGRTPADTPIVAAVGRRDPAGVVRLAMTGVAPVPVLVDDAAIDTLDPPGDFRGSTDYRRALATILGRRVLDEIGSAP